VLKELGYSADQIVKLHEEKVVGSTGADAAQADIRRAS
jgi:hypothetical protein